MWPFAGMVGQGAGLLNLPAFLSSSDFTFGQTAYAGIQCRRDGRVFEFVDSLNWVYESDGGEGAYIKTGYQHPTVGDGFECMLTGTGDPPTVDGFNIDQWYTLNQTVSWRILDASPVAGGTIFSGTLTVRRINNTADSVSCSVTLNADRDDT